MSLTTNYCLTLTRFVQPSRQYCWKTSIQFSFPWTWHRTTNASPWRPTPGICTPTRNGSCDLPTSTSDGCARNRRLNLESGFKLILFINLLIQLLQQLEIWWWSIHFLFIWFLFNMIFELFWVGGFDFIYHHIYFVCSYVTGTLPTCFLLYNCISPIMYFKFLLSLLRIFLNVLSILWFLISII